MSTGSIIAVAILVVFASLDTSVDASSSLITATPTATPTVTPSSSSQQPAPAQSVTPTPTTSAGGASTVTSSSSVAPTGAPRKKTCGNISFGIGMAWNESLYTNASYVTIVETELQYYLNNEFFNESSKYEDVKVSNLKFNKKDEKVVVTFKLCLIVKNDVAGYIEDILKSGLKFNNMEVTEFEFKADGVELGDWKAKSDECKKCSDGGAGPIVIERACKPLNDNSCDGLKVKDQSKDCVEYCDSSADAIMMSSFILAMGILLSLSFNIWK